MKMPTTAMTSPRTRMVVVGGFPFGDPDPQHEFMAEVLEVVAFSRDYKPDVDGEPTAFNEVLVWDPYEFREVADLSKVKERYLAFELVSCHWDPSEDDQRLAPIIRRVLDAAWSSIYGDDAPKSCHDREESGRSRRPGLMVPSS